MPYVGTHKAKVWAVTILVCLAVTTGAEIRCVLAFILNIASFCVARGCSRATLNLLLRVLQLFRLNVEGQVAVGERCIDQAGSGLNVIMCPVQPSGPWSWDKVNLFFNR